MDAYWGQVASARKTLLASVMAQGQAAPADRQAKVVALADQLGIPPEVAAASYDSLTQRDRAAGIDTPQLLKDHPNLAKWLVMPGNAGIAQDSLPQLQHLDSMASALTGTYNPGGILPQGFMFSDRGDGTIRGPLNADGTPPVVYKNLDDLRNQLSQQVLSSQEQQQQFQAHLEASSEVGGLPQALEAGVQGSIGSTAAAVLSATNWWSKVFGGGGHMTIGGLSSQDLLQFSGEGVSASELADASLMGGLQRTVGGLIGDAPLYMAGGGLARVSEALPGLADIAAKATAIRGLSTAPITGLRDLMPLMKALRATAPLPAVPVSSYAAEVWKNAVAFSPLAARSGINTGEEHGAAYGSLDFLINALGPGMAGRLGLATAEKAAGSAAAAGGLPAVLASFAGHSAAQGGAMGATELASALHEYATGVDPDALRADHLLPRMAQAGAMGGLLTAAFHLPGAVGELTMRRQMAANASMRAFDARLAVAESYSAAATTDRSPARSADLLQRLIPDQARLSYMQADDLHEAAAKVGMTPEALAQALNATDEYKQALATGKVMHVSTADLTRATDRIEDPTQKAALHAYISDRPDGMIPQDALQFYKEAPEEIAGLHASMNADVTAAAKNVKESDPIYQDMMSQAEEAGRPSQEARDDARLMAARFNTLTARWNEGAEARGARKLDPHEEYQRFQLKLQQAQPGAQVQDVTDSLLNRIREGNIPTERQAYGPSLMEFLRKRGIRDTGGDLASMDIDKELKPGESKLVDPEGLGMDIAAQRAHEHGYIESEDPNALLEAIGREQFGKKVYAEGQGDAGHQQVRELLDEIQRTMSEKGAHIGMSNAAIKAKLAGAEGPAVGRYEQMLHGPPLTVKGKPVIAADVPYGGGSSKDGSKIYIDRRIPRYAKIDGKTVDLWEAIAEHEIAEKKQLDQGKSYAESHITGTHADDADIDHQGVKHADYENYLKPFLERAKREAPKGSVPDDLEDRPYHEMGEANLLAGKSVRYEQSLDRVQARAVAGDTLAHEGNVQTGALDAELHGTRGAAKALSDLLEGVPAIPESDRVLSGPALREMIAQVRAAVAVEPKVLDAIVRAVPVHVVDNLFGSEAAAKVALHDEPVFKDSAALNADLPVPKTIDASSPIGLLLREVARESAKSGLRTTAAETGRKSIEGAAASRAVEKNAPPPVSFSQKGAADNDHSLASISFNAERHFLITLSGRATLASTLHESAHFWFETMGDYAMDPQAPPQLREDYQKLLEFSGYGTHETKQAMQGEQAALAEKLRLEDRAPTAAETARMAGLVAPHEKVARAMEQYLMDGHAPSPELRGTFQRFRLWLTDIYRQIKSLVTLTPEVKGVFDRMLATDDAISQVQKELGQSTLFPTLEKFGGTPENYQKYLQAISDARNQADSRVFTQAMKVLRAEKTKAWTREKDGLREAASKLINAKPQYVAERALVHGMDKDGEPLEHAPKLDRKAIEKDYPGARGQMLRGITTDEPGGWSLEFAAQQFGFNSAADLYEAMLRKNFVKRPAAIEHLSEQIMQGRHPEMSADAMHEAAMQAVHANSAQADVLSRESAVLALKANRTPIAREQFKGIAEGLINDANHRDINHDSYVRAEKQFHNAAADELAKDKPDYTLAFQLNQRAELAHACYRASMEAEETIADTVDLMRKGLKREVRQMIGRAGGYVVTGAKGESFVTIDPKAAAQVAEETKGSTESFLQHYDRMTATWKDKPTRYDMTMGAVTDLNRDATQIMHLAKDADTILREGKAEKLSEAVADLTDNQREAAKDKIVAVPRTKGTPHLFMQYLRQFEAGNRTIAGICRALDGEKGGGYHWNLINRPLNKAGDNETVRKLANMAWAQGAFKDWGKRGVRGNLHIPEIGEALDLENRIAVALYAGTKEGLERMMTGDKWSRGQITAIIKTLDKKDLGLVKAIWAHHEAAWPEISATYKRLNGIEPKRSFTIPVETAHGTVDGGYYPIQYDGEVGARAYELALQRSHEAAGGTPKAGFTVSRVETTGLRLQYGFEALFRHNDETAHWLSHAETAQDLNRIINDKRFMQSTIDRFGVTTYDALRERVQNVLEGPRGPQNALERGLRFVRTRTGLATMGYNLMTFVSHGFGVFQNMQRVGAAEYMAAEGQLLSNAGDAVKGYAFVKAKSDFMRNHGANMTPESIERIRSGAAGGVLMTIHDHALDLLHHALFHINSATWMAEYKSRMAESPEDESRAIDLADQAVRDTQGSGQTVDKTFYQDKNEYVKVLSQYLSFFTRTYQMLRPSVAGFSRGGYKDAQTYANAAKAFAMLVILPATTEALFRQAVRPSPENDNSPEFWLKKLSAANAEYALSSVFLGRELAGAFEGHGTQDPAAMRSMTSVVGASKQMEHFLANPDIGSAQKVGSTAATLAGTYFGLPVTQVSEIIRGVLYDSKNGTFDPRAPLFGPPPTR